MKIALKYGLLITLGVIVWAIVAHLVVPDPRSQVHGLGAPVFFNLLEIVGIYLGIKASANDRDGFRFKTDVKTGVAIAFVYAVSSSLFFMIAILSFGSGWMAGESGASHRPVWQQALGAFTGLLLGGVLLGLIYSTIISFFFARLRRN
jgi:hypothetical protein